MNEFSGVDEYVRVVQCGTNKNEGTKLLYPKIAITTENIALCQ